MNYICMVCRFDGIANAIADWTVVRMPSDNLDVGICTAYLLYVFECVVEDAIIG